MDKYFEILETFLANWQPDVAGRTAEEIPPELRERLRVFAQARLGGQDRAELAELLKQHPEWVRVLASQIKAQRSQPGSAKS